MKKKLSKRLSELSNSISEKSTTVKKELHELTTKSNDDERIKELKDEYYKTIDKAEEIKDEIIVKLEEKSDTLENSKKMRILGIKIWRIMMYLVIYSFFGFCLETLYGLLTKGVIESRQSFLYGPFLRNLWGRSCYDYCTITIFQPKPFYIILGWLFNRLHNRIPN